MEEEMDISWYRKGKIDEQLFCLEFLTEHQLVYTDGAFFSPEGRLPSEEILRKEIYETLAPFVTTGISRRVDNILEVLKLECRKENLPYQTNVLHVKNGTLHIKRSQLLPQKECCRYRLPVNYNPDCGEPKLWLSFLDQLLEPEDIPTLQEFMGYCLIPTTIAQKMLLLIGNGGEGKSRIGVVMKAMLGNAMSISSVAKVEQNQFARADLEHLLVLVDDDLKMEALNQTNYIKTIVTAELPMDLERKGIQSYQGRLHARLMAFGNGNLQAIHDRSYGFFRRQIILTTRHRDPNRVDDPFLGERLKKEIDQIFMWSLAGLYRLIGQNFRFTVSERAKRNMEDAICEGNNMVEFFKTKDYFRMDPKGEITSRQLYNLYREWCDDNAMKPMGTREFWSTLRQTADRYGIEFTYNVATENGKHARGFRGICPLDREQNFFSGLGKTPV